MIAIRIPMRLFLSSNSISRPSDMSSLTPKATRRTIRSGDGSLPCPPRQEWSGANPPGTDVCHTTSMCHRAATIAPERPSTSVDTRSSARHQR
jgi:hypothetical protein